MDDKALEPLQEVYMALVLGSCDYVTKNGFKGVVISLSGGIDSSLVASIAVDALGKKNVTGLFMPSPYTSGESKEDVHDLVSNLGVNIEVVPLSRPDPSYLDALKKEFQ